MSETKNQFSQQSQPILIASISPQDRKTALWLFFVPLTGLVLTDLLYPTYSFVEKIHYKETPFPMHNLIVILLGFSSLIFFLATLVCIPIALSMLNKKTASSDMEFDQRSGKGNYSVVPEEIKEWSWGAAGLNVIWGVNFRVWISLLSLIPFLNIFWWIVLGIKGNEWAWKKNPWKNIEEFKKTQNTWRFWGIVFFILNGVATIATLYLNFSLLL